MVTLVRLSQPENALSPMAVTDDGMVTLVRLVQSENAQPSMVVTVEGMVYVPDFPEG